MEDKAGHRLGSKETHHTAEQPNHQVKESTSERGGHKPHNNAHTTAERKREGERKLKRRPTLTHATRARPTSDPTRCRKFLPYESPKYPIQEKFRAGIR